MVNNRESAHCLLWLTEAGAPHRIKVQFFHNSSLFAAPSFNGRTADSGSAYRGSNPWGAARLSSHDCSCAASEPLNSAGKAHLAEQGGETRIVANLLPARIQLQPYQPIGTLAHCLVEYSKGLLLIPHS